MLLWGLLSLQTRSTQGLTVLSQRRHHERMSRTSCYSKRTEEVSSSLFDRRSAVSQTIATATTVVASVMMTPTNRAIAEEEPEAVTIRAKLEQAADTLQKLVDNWSKAVIDCTYADVPRDLLETKNKEQLLEKASTYALFDKSVSVVSCKTTNRVVRDYLGLTGIGPLTSLDTTLRAALDVMESGDDDSLALVEDLQRALSRADSLSYMARRDFTAFNNFDPDDEEKILSSSTNLLQTKEEIQTAVGLLKRMIALIPQQ